MAKVKVFNIKAEEVGEINLKKELFGVEYNEPLIHEVIVAFNANQRQGNKSTLTRSEVRGHSAKPYRQKGTGRARQGSTKGPQYKGGGIVFAPKPRDFSKKTNKQARRIALLSALSEKFRDGNVTVLDKFTLESAKTKEAQNFLNAFKFDGSVLVVSNANDEAIKKSTANIKTLSIEETPLLNVYEVVACKNLVLTKDAIKSIEEAYAE